jgi:hypothetical protein
MLRKFRGTIAASAPRGDCFFSVTAVTAVTDLISRGYFCNGAVLAARYARYTIDFVTLFKKAYVMAKQTFLGSPTKALCFVASGKPRVRAVGRNRAWARFLGAAA